MTQTDFSESPLCLAIIDLHESFSLISRLFLNTRAVCRIPTWVLVSLNVQSSHITCLTLWMLAGHELLCLFLHVFSHLPSVDIWMFCVLTHSLPFLPLDLCFDPCEVCVCVCVFSLYQGKEVCLWFLISSAAQTPADPPPFIPCPTCKPLDLWLAVLMRVYVYPVCVLVLVVCGWVQMQMCICASLWACICMSACLYVLIFFCPSVCCLFVNPSC